MKKTLLICSLLCLLAATTSVAASGALSDEKSEAQTVGNTTVASATDTDSENGALDDVESPSDNSTDRSFTRLRLFGQSIGIYRIDWKLDYNKVTSSSDGSASVPDGSNDTVDPDNNYIEKADPNQSLMLDVTLPLNHEKNALQLIIGFDVQQVLPPSMTETPEAPNESDVTTPTTTINPTTVAPTTQKPTTVAPTTQKPTTVAPTTQKPTTVAPTTQKPTTVAPTTQKPTTVAPTTQTPTTVAPTTQTPTTVAPTTQTPTTVAPTTQAPTTVAPTTQAPTTVAPTTQTPTTVAPTTQTPTTQKPVTQEPVTTKKPIVELGAIPTTVPAMEYTEEEYDLLARIIHCEAGGEEMEGMIAVGSVVLNRVNSSVFPNNIHDVIFQKGQFTPALSGKIYRITPNKKSCEAARRVLEGERTDTRILYFRLSKYASEPWMNGKRTLIVTIDKQSFYS